MPLAARVNRWYERHLLFCDFLSAILLLFLPATASAQAGGNSLLYGQSTELLAIWSMVYCVPLAARRKAPDVCAWLCIGFVLLRWLIGPFIILNDVFALMALFAAIARGSEEWQKQYIFFGIVLPPAACLLDYAARQHRPLLAGTNNGDAVSENLPVAILFAFIALALSLITIAFARHRRMARRQARLLRERNHALELSARQREQEAEIAERARIARDLHDIVAHTLSILIVQADGGRYAGTQDPSLALQTMRTIRSQAQKALANTANLFAGKFEDGEGREDHEDRKEPSAASSSSMAAIPQETDYRSIGVLVDEAGSMTLGRLHLTRRITGTPDLHALSVSPSLSRTLYRTVEESLSNIRKYSGIAGGRTVDARIEEDWAPGMLTLRITDDGQGNAAKADGHSAGYGLIGMRERVESSGGHLTTGPLPDGGFGVTAVFPIGSAENRHASDRSKGSFLSTARSERSARSRQTDQRDIPRLRRNTLIVDGTIAAIMLLFVLAEYLPALPRQIAKAGWPPSPHAGFLAFSELLCFVFGLLGAGALAFRRLFPQPTAIVCAATLGASLLASWAVPTALMPAFSCVTGLIALYAIIAYGPASARKWAYPSSAVLVVMASADEMARFVRRASSASAPDAEHGGVAAPPTRSEILLVTVLSLIVTAGAVLLTIFSALLQREKDQDPLLLALHQQALLDRQQQGRQLATRRERERISHEIHDEVTRTLTSVRSQAGQAIGQLEEIDARSTKGHVSPEDQATIARLFSQTATQCRQVLACIRELLGVLRGNEAPAAAHAVPLAPLAGTPSSSAIPPRSTDRIGNQQHSGEKE